MCTRLCTHSHTHIHEHSYVRFDTDTNTQTCTNVHTNTHTYTHIHTHKHTKREKTVHTYLRGHPITRPRFFQCSRLYQIPSQIAALSSVLWIQNQADAPLACTQPLHWGLSGCWARGAASVAGPQSAGTHAPGCDKPCVTFWWTASSSKGWWHHRHGVRKRSCCCWTAKYSLYHVESNPQPPQVLGINSSGITTNH